MVCWAAGASLYAAHISDLRSGGFVVVERGGWRHDGLIHRAALPSPGLGSDERVVDLAPRLRCRECDARGKARSRARVAEIAITLGSEGATGGAFSTLRCSALPAVSAAVASPMPAAAVPGCRECASSARTRGDSGKRSAAIVSFSSATSAALSASERSRGIA